MKPSWIKENYDLDNYNTYKIKCTAKYMGIPHNKEELQELINYLEQNEIKYIILGKGSNVILPDKEYNGCVISLENMQKIEIKDDIITAECGILLAKLVNVAINHDLEGLEYLTGIPGTLGGALYGNAGAYEHTIYDYLESIVVFRNNKFITLKKEDIKTSYRYTSFKENHDILVEASFKLPKGNIEEMQDKAKDILEKRKRLPLEYPNAGSVFKNPEGDYAGRLIETLGLKGYQVGDAKVSEKHANFIVNVGNMQSKDVQELIKEIQRKVEDAYQIKLELEQIIIDGN